MRHHYEVFGDPDLKIFTGSPKQDAAAVFQTNPAAVSSHTGLRQNLTDSQIYISLRKATSLPTPLGKKELTVFKRSLFFILLALLPGLFLAKPVPERTQVRNLAAFTRLWGYVKHWYPSDEAQSIDWDRFAVLGSRQVIDAPNDRELQARLLDLFSPLVPELQLFGKRSPAIVLFHPVPGRSKAFWQYSGYENTGESSVYASIRANRPQKIRNYPGYDLAWSTLMPKLPPSAEPETKVRVMFRVRELMPDSLTTYVYAGFAGDSAVDSLSGEGWEVKSYELDFQGGDSEPVWFGIAYFQHLQLDDVKVERWIDGAWQSAFETGFEDDVPGVWPRGFNLNFLPIRGGQGHRVELAVENSPDGNLLAIRKSPLEQEFTLGLIDRIFDEELPWGELLEKPLVRGLNCRFPMVLQCDIERTYPVCDTTALNALRAELANIDIGDRGDRHVWLAGLIKYWNELAFFYPYFEYGLCDWDAELPLALARVLRSRDFAQYKQALLLLMSQTRDGHAFLSDQAHNSKMPRFTTSLVEGKWVVSKVLDPSLDLPAGSRVTKMNGKNFAKLMRENRPYFIMGNPQTTDLKLFSRYLKTYPDSVATFEFITPDGRKITRTTPFAEYESWQWATPDAKIIHYPDGIVYVNPNAITEAEFQEALPDLVAARGIILDLRFYLSISTTLLQHLQTAPDPLANTLIKRYIRPGEELPRINEDEPTWGSKPAEPHIGAKVVALSGRESQSYCEMYLAVLKHNRLATLVGQPSAGANGNVVITDLPGGLKAYWTGMLVRQDDRSRFHGVGIIPDILVETTLDDIVQGRDPVLEKALELLQAE